MKPFINIHPYPNIYIGCINRWSAKYAS